MELKSPEKETQYKAEVDEKGNVILKKKKNVKKGRKARSQGASFELKVREDLEGKGWIVAKWSDNIDLENDKIISAKKHWKYNPFMKRMMPSAQGTGFPDFIAFQKISDEGYYRIVGVEVKMNGSLSKVEKEKCKWMLDNEIFSDIWIAKKEKQGRNVVVDYINFKEKWGSKV